MILTFAKVKAQEFKFGKVSKEEIEQKNHAVEKEAEAAILYKKERVNYEYDADNGFTTRRYVHSRIKIYNKSGLDWGTIKVPLYTSGNGEERITSIKGFTYNMAGGKVSETKLKKEGIFREKVNKYRNQASIAMPGVKEGSVIDVEYKIVSDFAGNIDDFQFQYGIPINQVDVTVEIPEYYVFKKYSRGFYPMDIKQTKKNRTMQVNYRVENDPGRLNGGKRSSDLSFFENIYKINTQNIPSLKNENFTNNIDNYRSSLKFELASTRFPNKPYKNYSLQWDDVAEAIYKYEDFGGELRKSNTLKEVVEKIKTSSVNDNQLANLVYNYVRDHMNWNGYFGVSSENGLKKAFEQKTGNVGDINLMLTMMLRYAGFDANPVLVSTKANGIPLFPTFEGFNYVIAAIENDNGIILMDATEKMAPIGILPNRALNWQGRLVRTDGTSNSVDLFSKNASKKIVMAHVDILANGSAEGKMRTQLTDNLAFTYRNNNKGKDNEQIMDALEGKVAGMEVNDLKITNQEINSKPILESCSFTIESSSEVVGDKIYFKPALFLAMEENPFKQDKRDYPVDFEYLKSNKMSVTYNIPEGYQVESIPESKALALPDNLGNFKYAIAQNGNKLQFTSTVNLNTVLVPSDYYESLKLFFSQIVTKQEERVILSKI
jgi:hypothetical protein